MMMNQKELLIKQFQAMNMQDKFDKILVYGDGLRQADENYVGLYALLLECKNTITDEECNTIYTLIMEIVYHNSTHEQLNDLITQISQKK